MLFYFRCMFLIFCVLFIGIDLEWCYMVLMDIVFVDNKWYRYVYYCLFWLVVGKVDFFFFICFYMYFDLFFIGE